MRSRRDVDELEFDPTGDVRAVVAAMDRLATAHDGWINLVPGVPEEVEPPSEGIFNALFGTAQPPVSMCTWMPAARRARPMAARAASEGGRTPEETVGIMHSRGRFAVAQLGSMGVGLPEGWRVSQDHRRRGLIVHPPPGAPHEDVLDWSLRAGAALATVPLTGRWKARVFQPH